MLTQYQHIQVSVDGSKEADLAFSKAVAIAKRNGAILDILHVIDTRSFQNVSSFDSAMVEQVSNDAKKRMEEYKSRAIKAGIKDVHYSIEFGSPKTIIARDFPKKHNGSVTEYVTRTANCDVLVCRTQEIKDALSAD